MCFFKKATVILLIIGIVIAVPVVFNLIFIGNQGSKFLFINSNLSVSDWFSFWIAYISAIISSILAFAAIKLSETIEIAHENREAEHNKEMFIIDDILIKWQRNEDNSLDYEVDIVLPIIVNSISDITIKDATITFGDKSVVKLACPNKIQGNLFKLGIKQENKETFCANIPLWLNWRKSMTTNFETIKLDITYNYPLNSFDINKKRKKYFCTTTTSCSIISEVDSPDKKKVSNYYAHADIFKN